MIVQWFMGGSFALGGYLVLSEVFGLRRKTLTARLTASQPSVIDTFFLGFFAQLKRTLFGSGLSRKRTQAALYELPEILELMAVALTSGDGMFVSFARVVPRANGVLALELKSVLTSLELGGDMESELRALAKRIPQRQVVEFANKLVLSLRRGSPLASLLREQAASARAEIRNDLLRQAGKNETRMLIPLIFLILPVTILFAIYPSLQLLNMNYL